MITNTLILLSVILLCCIGSAFCEDQRRTGYVVDTSENPFILTSEGKGFGDPMPVYWDGVWHLYSLSTDIRTVIHFTSTDLVKWVEHKPAMVGEGIATGTVVRHENKYHLFYTDSSSQTIHLVTSSNPWEFDFSKNRLLLEADGKTYQKGWFRDCYVFYNEQEKLWWMLIEGRSPEVCTGLFKSKDLLTWTQSEPMFKDKAREFGSCPQIFKQDNLWYLAIQDLGNCYYTANTPYGPWKDRGQYLSVIVEAASRFATDGKRQLTWGWLCDWAARPKVEILSYGGPLSIGREIVFKKDGTLGTRPLPELLIAIRKKKNDINLASARKLSGEWNIDLAKQTLKCSSAGVLVFDLPVQNPNYYFEAELDLGSPQTTVNIITRSSDNTDHGYGFALSPAEKKITIRDFNYAADHKILNDKPYSFPKSNKVRLQIFICDNYMEAFIDNQECLSARVVDHSSYKLAIETTDGPVKITKPFLHYFAGR